MGQSKTLSTSLLVLILFCSNFHAYLSPRGSLSGKQWPPGSPWPLPFFWSHTETLVTFDAAAFRILKDFSTPCEPIDFIISKYNTTFLFPVYERGDTRPDPALPFVHELKISVTGGEKENECSNYPKLSDDPGTYEAYDLKISVENGKGVAKVTAKTVWGAIHGVETFSQLIWSNGDTAEVEEAYFYANATVIHDKPRFPHRGLMIDSARHYLPERIFYEVLDGMMYNKLNVLHWHIVDDQSFPYVSRKFPELSKMGAFNDKAIYTPEMVQRVITAAKIRGIRVIFEFDTPGHTHSFGKAFPELLTPCYGNGPQGDPEAPHYPRYTGRENLDPTNKFTYDFMREFFTELADNVTKDAFVHLGMDEVYTDCWDPQHNPVIRAFLKKHNYTSPHQVKGHYDTRHAAMVQALNLTPICWQDPVDQNVNLDKSVVVQVWKAWDTPWTNQFKNVLAKGYRAILSTPWYLNKVHYGETWKQYYKSDPVKSLPSLTEDEKSRILGGEACIWGEYVDKTNIIPRIFPFVGAVGERLWSMDAGISDEAAYDARGRLDQLRCRLLRRGINVEPIQSGYCGRWETENRRRR